MAKKLKKIWYVYIIECGNGKLYTGITIDIKRRLRQHTNGSGARFTKLNGVKALVYQEISSSRPKALKREIQIKRWPRLKKLQLIENSQD